MQRLALLLGLIVLAPGGLRGQQAQSRELRGRVLDAYSTFPIARTRVVLTSGRDTVGDARTDSAGFFQARVAASRVWAHFTRLGYRPDSALWDVSELPLRVAMHPVAAPPTLAAVNVRARISMFDRRARRGIGGRFISPEQIAAVKPIQTSDLLRAFSGVKLLDSAGIIQAYGHRSLRPNPVDAARSRSAVDPSAPRENRGIENCPMRVGIDGRLMLLGFSLNEVRVAELYGIEVYSGVASMPAEYASLKGHAQCGLVMIWTNAARERS